MSKPDPASDAVSASQRLADELANSAVIEHRTERAQRVAVPSTVTRQRVVRVSLAAAVSVLIAVLIATFAWEPLLSVFAPTPSAEAATQQAQEMLDALVVEIDAFRNDYDELPATLVDIGVPPRGQWRYTATSRTHYIVEGAVYGKVVSFDSASVVPSPGRDR
jgi:hypothetical protein